MAGQVEVLAMMKATCVFSVVELWVGRALHLAQKSNYVQCSQYHKSLILFPLLSFSSEKFFLKIHKNNKHLLATW